MYSLCYSKSIIKYYYEFSLLINITNKPYKRCIKLLYSYKNVRGIFDMDKRDDFILALQLWN